MIEIRGDKQPIGKFEDPKPFETHHFNTEKGDQLYLFSDGYADQFGGDKGKKFKSKNFKTLLTGVYHLDIVEQKNEIESVFEDWKGDLEQLDDVCVIGVKI